MGPDATENTRTIAELGEFDLISRVTAGRAQSEATLLGPGDDAAVLASGGSVVAGTDVLVNGVHFRFDWSTPHQVGRKAAAVNLSDIAAMGAVPTGLLVGLACPPETPIDLVDDLSAGLAEEGGQIGVGVVGGDMVSSSVLTLSVTALGDMRGRGPVTRAGARPGDVLAVAGRLGWSVAGYAVLARGFRSPLAVVGAHRVPEPPYEAGPSAAAAGATSMVDVSDGLLADLGHVAAASEVAIDVRSDLLDVPHRLSEVASALGTDARTWVLTGGEDQALAATFPDESAVPGGWRILGEVTGGGRSAGGGRVTVDGAEFAAEAGWQHWR